MADRDPRIPGKRSIYAADYAAWIGEQAALLEARRFAELDIDNLVDEVRDLGVSTYRAFISALRIVLLHMLKWDAQPAYRSRSWADSIEEHRNRVQDELDQSPSLTARLPQALLTAYRQARAEARSETGLELSAFPDACPFSWHDIMSRPHQPVP